MRYVFVYIVLLVMGSAARADEWWERETQMSEGGTLDLSQKEWWPKAQALKAGEFFQVVSKFEGGGRTIVRRETRTGTRTPQYLLVWILDDDGDMTADASYGDGDSDCYVVDYGCDGTVDRLVDYLDADSNDIPDEMDIRYFVDGALRRAWFGTDLDGDGSMWDVADYEYTGNFFRSDPYGNNEIYMNKYNPKTNAWIPISECPFTFYDTDGDGQSEAVVRFSVAPLVFSPESDPDYANSLRRFEGAYDESMEKMGVVNVRYSLDIDGLSDAEHPLHYDVGFNMVGSLSYDFQQMNRTQNLRRAPKTTVCVPFERARQVAETYPAKETGFSWFEFEDGSIKIGYPENPESDRRWEGVFWTWRRRIMHNTGGPVQHWNIRREYRLAFADRRELYFSPVDRRIHLKGASEGWTHVGYIGSATEIGELRTFDSNEDGYIDRWEYYWSGEDSPYRVAYVPDVENRDFAGGWKAIGESYTREVLPDAIRANEETVNLLKSLCGTDESTTISSLSGALERDVSSNERRFILDWMREYYYRRFVREMRKQVEGDMRGVSKNDPRSDIEIRKQSTQTWERAASLSRFEAAYARGDYVSVAEILRGWGRYRED